MKVLLVVIALSFFATVSQAEEVVGERKYKTVCPVGAKVVDCAMAENADNKGCKDAHHERGLVRVGRRHNSRFEVEKNNVCYTWGPCTEEMEQIDCKVANRNPNCDSMREKLRLVKLDTRYANAFEVVEGKNCYTWGKRELPRFAGVEANRDGIESGPLSRPANENLEPQATSGRTSR